MAKQVKCQYCSLKDEVEKMVKGEHPKGYLHIGCIAAYIKDRAFKEKERLEMDSLTDTIVRIMGYTNRQSIPHTFYSSYLQPFRNDDVLFGKLDKKYKKGFSYKTIEETFLYCEDSIKKYIGMKREKNSFKDVLGELRYAWKIVRENIENTLKAQVKTSKQSINNHKMIEALEVMEDVNDKIKMTQKQNMNKQDEDTDKVDLMSLFD